MSKIIAPWSHKRVNALNKYQISGDFHPYTCPYKDEHPDDETLVATEHGWVCPHCTYTQDWAHLFSITMYA